MRIKLHYIIYILLLAQIHFAQQNVDLKDSILAKVEDLSPEVKVEKLLDQIRDLRSIDVITSFDLYDVALKIALENDFHEDIATLYEEAALNYTFMDQYEKAIEYHNLALEKTNQLDDKTLLWKIYNNTAVINYLNGNYYESIYNFKKAEDYVSREKSIKKHAVLFNNLGELYRITGMLDESADYHRKALKIFRTNDFPEDEFYTILLLSETLIKQERYTEAESILKKYDNLEGIASTPNSQAVLSKLRGYIKIQNNNIVEGLKYFDFALQESARINDRYLEKDINTSLADALSKRGKFALAYKHIERAQILGDSLNLTKKLDKSNLYRIRAEKERMAAKENAVQLETERSKNQLLFLTLGASILIVILITIAYSLKKKTESQLRLHNEELELLNNKFIGFVEQSKDAFRIIDPSGKIVLWSKANEELTGIHKSDALNKNYLDITYKLLDISDQTEERLMQIRTQVEKLLKKGNFEPITVQKQITTPKGDKKYMLDTIFPIVTNNEIYLGSISRDNTQRHNFEEEIISAKEKAEASERIKTDFLAQMSHEIRTPVNTILSFISLIEEELKESENDFLLESFVSINNAGGRIIRTIDLLLNMSEIQTGTYETLVRKISVGKEIIEPIILEYELITEKKNLQLIYNPNEEDYIIFADEYSVTQIIHNLVSNAVKFTEKGSIELRAGLDENNNVFIEVRDTGIGISEEYLEKLFIPFTQEEQGYTRSFEGNGLGLALVKKYCEVNDANIDVQSTKGKGSCFTVTFPARSI